MHFLLLPFAWIYGTVIRVRNFLYNRGWLRSFQFDFPIILTGNLSTGGSGKTPHTEYLIRLLRLKYRVTTLSRGYKRTYRGFGLATELSLVEDIGDEPKLYKQKYPDVEVAVSEDRVGGVYMLLQDAPETEVVLMDDGFQHRRITAGFNILLTTFGKPFFRDHLLPAGRLREHRHNARRAQVVIVTKCPNDITAEQRSTCEQQIKRYTAAPVFFTTYTYAALRPLFADQQLTAINGQKAAVLLTGIAGSAEVLQYMQTQHANISPMAYADHHYFTDNDIAHIAAKAQPSGIVITTEKDAMRLMEARTAIEQHGLSIFVQPIEVAFLGNAEAFDRLVLEYIEKSRP